MRTQKKDRSRLIAAAMQKIQCDMTVENVQLVNVLTGEIYPASVDILDGMIVRVREKGEETSVKSKEIYDGGGKYMIPGFIDTHMHVESSMMLPENLGRAAAVWGTTTVCTDPHEIANVMGIDGVRFMLENGKKQAIRHYVLAPSSVPAVPALEGNGAYFGAEEVGEILDMDGVVGIAEIMDYVGVYNDCERMHGIIDEGIKRNMFLQGHSPMARGKELAAYILGGPKSDHESSIADEVREKLRNGMHINLRASSIIDALTEQKKGIDGQLWHDNVSICTDDVHAKDLLEKGHINAVVRKLIEMGMEPIEAIKLASYNAAREYNFEDLGAIAPGYAADFQLVKRLDGNMPSEVFVDGRLVAENGVYTADDDKSPIADMPNTVNMPQIASPEDFLMKAPEGCGDSAKILVLTRNGGNAAVKTGRWMELPVKNGYVSIDGHDELQFVCVANRYGSGDKNIAVMDCFDMKEGAMATTVSHDSHNFTVFYKDIDSAWACAERLKETGGGMCAAKDGKVISAIELPVAGLMSTHACKEVSDEIENIENTIKSLCGEEFTLLMLVVFSLPVLPGLTLTDRGMIDGMTQRFVQQSCLS
ncbi:MAG: adenine deaminase C-terminal domain-containing protein [Clostridia bacterium]|nr:adenine deaminase C-terminal domain-containing protein [Clostridia bacterium]